MSMDIIRLFILRDEECLKVLEELRWHGEPECPYCGSKDVRNMEHMREAR